MAGVHFRTAGSWSNWFTLFPKWQDPNGSAVPISYAEILAAGGKSPPETAAVVEELESLMAVDSLLLPA